MEEKINNMLRAKFGRSLSDCTKEEIFEVLLCITREKMEQEPRDMQYCPLLSALTATWLIIGIAYTVMT